MGISKEQALDCLRSADLIGIGMEADGVRRKLHPENVVSYAVAGSVSVSPDGIDESEAAGVDSISLVLPLGITFVELEKALTAIRLRFPSLRVSVPSAGVLLRLSEAAGLNAAEAATRLRDAGLSTFGAEDLETGGDSKRLLELHCCAHRAGLRTTAGMVFGAGESLEDRSEHLFALRELQEETGGFAAFALRSFVPAGGALEAPTAVEYLRTLAVTRMVLDNIEHVESNCLAQGLKVTQMALRFGANDAGLLSAGGLKSFTEEDLRRVIRDAGFRPVERDILYRTMFLNN